MPIADQAPLAPGLLPGFIVAVRFGVRNPEAAVETGMIPEAQPEP